MLSIFKLKTAFSAFFKSINAGKRPFLRCFCIFRVALKAYLTSLSSSTSTPKPGTPLPIVGPPSRIYIYIYILYIIYYVMYYIILIIYIYRSFCLSYWSPEKSYMTSSCTATSIYIAARFRVNLSPPGGAI